MSPARKVVHLTTAHASTDVRIRCKECRSLARAGYEVALIAQGAGGTGADGVTVVGLRAPRSRYERMTRGILEAWRAARRENADVYHFHDPELLPLGLLLKATGRRVIYDIHEDLPKQVLHKDWLPRGTRRALALSLDVLERVAANILDGVIVATPAIGRRFSHAYKAVVQNFPLSGELSIKSQTPYDERPSVVTYVGGIQEVRGIREMAKAVELVGQTRPVRLELAGEFYPATIESELRREAAWKHIDYKGTVSRAELAVLMSRARVGLVLFHPLPNHVEAQPNKLFEYMSAGIPVVASDFPLWREIVGEAKCGLLVDPLDPSAIADAVRWLFDHPLDAERMGCAGREAVRTRFNWEQESERLLGFYQKLLV